MHLTETDCIYEGSVEDGGVGPGDAIVSLEYGRPNPLGWEVRVRLLFPLSARGDLGGANYRAVLTRDLGTWRVAALELTGAP